MLKNIPIITLNVLRKTTQISTEFNGTIFRRCIATKKRFYKNTGVLSNDGKFEVTLDQRKLKTPKGNLFQVENEMLAMAVAAEWNAQKQDIKQSSMHLTALCSTVLDNPSSLTKYDIVQQLMGYLETDTVLFLSGEEDELYDVQLKEWSPIISWFCQRYNVNIQPSRDFTGPEINAETTATLSRHLLSHNFWAIHGYIFAIEALKSVILGMAVADRFINVEKAVALSRLEEDYQSGRWGRVEWAHDVTQQDSQARVSAGVLFIHLNSASSLTRNKGRAEAAG